MLHFTRSRRPLTALAVMLFILFAFFTGNAVGAVTGTDLPSRNDVQSQLDALNKQKDHTAVDKLVIEDLTATLETLDKIDRVKQETALLKQKVTQAPDRLRQATDALSSLSDKDNDDETRKTLATLSLRQLESRLAQLLDDLQTSQNDLSNYNSQLVSLQTQPERVQNQDRKSACRERV